MPEIPERRIEVVEGVVLQVPRLSLLHQCAVSRLTHLIDEWQSSDYSALPEVEMVVSATPLTVRVPDVLVAPSSVVDANPPRFDAGDVRLVIEVLSEGTRRTDQVTKFSEYAEAGIEHYWIVDLDAPNSMITYRLVEGEYENFGEFSGVAELEFAGAPITIDLDALTTRRAQRP